MNIKTLLRFFIILLLFFSVSSLAKEYKVCRKDYVISQSMQGDKIKVIENILIKDPKNVECMLKLSALYLKNSQIADGFSLLKKAYTSNKEYVESRNISKILDLALYLSDLKDEAQRKNTKQLWAKLGDSYYELGAFGEAKEAYEHVIAIDENDTKYMVLLALSYGNIDEIVKADELLSKVLRMDAYNFYGNYYYAKLLQNVLNSPKEAKKYFMMAEYLIKYNHTKFDTLQEREFLIDDLKRELHR